MTLTYTTPRYCTSLSDWALATWSWQRTYGIRILGLEIEWRR